MAPVVTIREKAEDAIEAFILERRGTDLQYTDVDGNTGQNIRLVKSLDGDPDETLELPFIIILVTEPIERPIETGNFDVPFEIHIRTSAVDCSRAEHNRLIGVITDMFFDSPPAVAAAITTAAQDAGIEITVQYIDRTPIAIEVDEDDGAIISVFRGSLYCWPSIT